MRFRIRSRRFDESKGCYVYDISFKTRSDLTERTVKVAEAFGLGIDDEREHAVYRGFELTLRRGDVVYVTGDSGSGKSALLREIERDLGEEAVNIADVQPDPSKPIVDTVGSSFQEALGLLSRVGLNDAFLFLRRYPELSDGQKYRYRIAKMIDSGKRFWLCDEFCSLLDRDTAKIVSFNIQKMARRSGATLIVATSHTDLEEDLNPSIMIRKGWEDEISVDYRDNREAVECTATKGITIREGSKRDYSRLSKFHYRDSRIGIPVKIFCAEKDGDLVGVIVYQRPSPVASGRSMAVGYSPRMEELNRDWATISRVVVHPKFRSTGLGVRLVRDTLPLCGRRHVELIAVMAQYNPFAERAGMRKIKETRPDRTVTAAVESLRGLGFSPVMLSSVGENLRILRGLGEGEVGRVKEILLSVDSVYYRKMIGRAKIFCRASDFKEFLSSVSLEGLARVLKMLSVLSEPKAYLYWCRDWVDGNV